MSSVLVLSLCALLQIKVRNPQVFVV